MSNNEKEIFSMANAIRALSMDAVEKAKSGHPGMPMGMADVATVLFTEFLRYNPEKPDWIDRDKFILSAGHGSMLLYSLLYLTGYQDINMEDIKNFRQLHSKTAGHPEYGHLKAIETTTGPLGQGLANSVGMAIAENILASKFGKDIINHYTYVIAGDGCLMEGISQEAISLAGHLNLNKLIVLFDDNGISIDGPTDLTISEDQLLRFKASGWNSIRIDGHNYDQIRKAINDAQKSDKPTLIACKTNIAFGAPTKVGTAASHGSPLGAKEIEGVREKLNWPYEPFVIPDEILGNWRNKAKKRAECFYVWEKQFNQLPKEKQQEIYDIVSCNIIPSQMNSLNELKKNIVESKPKEATRKSSGKCIKAIAKDIEVMIGGSADLTGSNDTKTEELKPISKDDFSGRYIYYGVREHAMGAIMNGMALHGGVIPYGGTFLVFSDYMRPAIRLSALMKKQIIYIMTHDSIGLGEDGPTHQPVEHLASLRAIPNLYVFRPADALETAEAWEIALKKKDAPSMLVLTRQNVPLLRDNYKENLSEKGAYILSEYHGKLDVTIYATGSEVEIAIAAQKLLHEKNIGTRVVSVICTRLFNEQDSNYKYNLLCNDSIKVAVEAALAMGWEKYIGPHGIFVGMNDFGASAPSEDLYNYFGITKENIVGKVSKRIEEKK